MTTIDTNVYIACQTFGSASLPIEIPTAVHCDLLLIAILQNRGRAA
jgi:hypothetical protein